MKPLLIALPLLLVTRAAVASPAAPPLPRPSETSWPMFRGDPALTGVAPGNLPDELALLWTAKTGGPVKSSAAISDGQVVIGSDDHSLYAFDLKTGRKNWSFQTGDTVESSPLLISNRVFVGSGDGFLYALEARTGHLLWKYKTGAKILGAPNCAYAVSSAGSNQPPGLAILIGSYDFKLHGVNAADGRALWSYESGNYINGAPAILDGQAVFGGCDGLLHFVSIDTGAQTKSVEAGGYVAASPAAGNHRVYVGQYENEFLCIDAAEGKQAWSFRDKNFPYFSSPALTGDRVIFGGRDKRVHCLRRDDGGRIWEFSARGKVDSSPVVCGAKVVVGSDDGHLYVLGLANGHELWNYEIGQAIASSPAIAAGTIIIGSEDGQVYAFGRKGEASKTGKKGT